MYCSVCVCERYAPYIIRVRHSPAGATMRRISVTMSIGERYFFMAPLSRLSYRAFSYCSSGNKATNEKRHKGRMGVSMIRTQRRFLSRLSLDCPTVWDLTIIDSFLAEAGLVLGRARLRARHR